MPEVTKMLKSLKYTEKIHQSMNTKAICLELGLSKMYFFAFPPKFRVLSKFQKIMNKINVNLFVNIYILLKFDMSQDLD